MSRNYDVAVIGGGPAGSTLGTLLKKYSPQLTVAIFEREQFPRDHVGESHLPAISGILNEMGVWDKVEQADFPIKIGGTYRWGATDDLWDLEFLSGQEFLDAPRPSRFEGQRRQTAFQVDRSIYDTILLDHAASLGCEVFQKRSISKVQVDGDKVIGLITASAAAGDDEVTAKYYVDCTGDSGLLRRALGIKTDSPTALRNIAIWDYWQDAEWAVTLGTGGTRIQVMSLGWGWLWFIPISKTRTSVGLVLPATYYKASGKSKEQIYADAISAEPLISKLLAHATAEGNIQATKDWNFISEQMAGDNWFLAGDSCGFADPILSAGMTLAHTSARKVAYSILELERGLLDPGWIKREYTSGHSAQIRHHMQFADYWYSSNGKFTDLKEYCTEISKSAGLSLDADGAFRWLATGGFALEEPGSAGALSYRVLGLKSVTKHLAGQEPTWDVTKTNLWLPALRDVVEEKMPLYRNGRIEPIRCYRKGAKVLPLTGMFKHAMEAVKAYPESTAAFARCVDTISEREGLPHQESIFRALETFEALLAEGWIKGKALAGRPFLTID
jgi:flavin-dependent dehydrogenase